MKIKRILSFIFALSLTVSAVSCDNSSEVTQKTGNTLSEDTVKSEDAVKNTSEINEPVGDNRITVHYDEVKVCGEDLSPSYPRAATADKIYYEKTPDDLNWYEDEVNNDKRSGFIVDLEDSSVTSDDHEEILPYDIISRDDNKIFYVKYYNDDRYNQKKIVSLDLSDGSEKSTDYMDIYYHDSDHSGDIYITDAGIIKGYNKSLEIIKEIDLTDQIYQLRDEYGIADMCVSDEGKIYISFTLNSGDGYKVFTIDDNDNLVSLTDKIMTEFIVRKDNIFIDKSGNIVLAGKETVSVIDSNNGNIIHTYKLDYVVDFLGPSNKYDMVYMSSDGLYGYSFDDNKKELIISDDVLPDLGSYYESAYLSGNKVYISLNDKSSSLKNTRTLYEIERKTGNIISKSAVSGIGMVNECIGDDGLLYYIASSPLPKKPEAVYRYEYSVYRHENYGDNTLLFKFPEIPNHNMSQGIIVNSHGEIMIPYMGEIGTKGVKPFIKVYDTAGNLKTTVYPENDNGCHKFILLQNDNGRIYIVEVNEDNTTEIHKYDETNYSIGEKVGEFESRYEYQNGFGDYDIMIRASKG